MLSPLSNTLSPLGVSRAPAAPAFSPADVAGLQLWLEADALTGLADGAPVTTWPDASGQGHDFAQAITDHRPTYETAQVNGHATLHFTTNDSLIGPDFAVLLGTTAATLFVVFGLDDPGVSQYGVLRTLDTGSDYWRYAGDGNGYFGVFRANRINTYPTSMPTTGTHLVAVVSGVGTGSYHAYLDGADAGARDPDFGGAGPVILGQDGVGNRLAGRIAEVIVYDSALADADRTAIEGYLNGKYSLY